MNEKIIGLRQQAFHRIASAMREFGYPDVTFDTISSAYDKWACGKELTDVVEMFAAREFDDAPQLFGEPKSDPE